MWKWRGEWSRRRNPKTTSWLFVSFVVFFGLFLLVREALPSSIFEPHLEENGVLFVWLLLSLVITISIIILLAGLVRMVLKAISN